MSKQLNFYLEKVKITLNVGDCISIPSINQLTYIVGLKNNLITLSNELTYDVEEFKLSLKNEELVLICDCSELLRPMPIFVSFYLCCPKCKDNQ